MQSKEEEKKRLFGRFTVVQALPNGSGGEAFKVRDVDGTMLFLKRAWNQPGFTLTAFKRELEVYGKLAGISDPAVLRVLHRFEAGEHLGFATEFAEGGTLEDFVYETADRTVDHAAAKDIAGQLVRGLIAIHGAGVVHRDVKPANIVRVGEHWKFVDFGIAKIVENGVESKTLQQAGTVGYAAPEQWEGVEASAEADVYSLAKVFVFLLRGETDPDMLAGSPWWPVVKACTSRERTARPKLTVLPDWIASL